MDDRLEISNEYFDAYPGAIIEEARPTIGQLSMCYKLSSPDFNAILPPDQESSAANISIGFAEFVERKFIPEYALHKRIAGRAHLQAILKYILPPERVCEAFKVDRQRSRTRLGTINGWPYMDKMRFSDITPESIQRLLSASAEHGYSAQTVIHIRNVIRLIFSYAILSGHYGGDNPGNLVVAPPANKKETSTLTLIQVKRAMELMRYPGRQVALFAMLTNMSVGEICGLKWKDIDPLNEHQPISRDQRQPHTLAVRMQFYRGEFGPVKVARCRNVAIPDTLYSVLHELSYRPEFITGEDFVLASRGGTPINPDNIAGRHLKLVATLLEFPALSWRVFQRTGVALKMEFGANFHKEIGKILPCRR
jgi:integrase